MKIYVVVRQDYESGSDGHEWCQNTENLAVFRDRDAAWALVHKEYGAAVKRAGSEEAVVVGFEVEEHDLC